MKVCIEAQLTYVAEDKEIEPIDFALLIQQSVVKPMQEEGVASAHIAKFERRTWAKGTSVVTVEWTAEEELDNLPASETSA